MVYNLIFQIERIYYPVLAAVGVPVNLVAIVILSRGKCGLSKCITYYLVGMAAADLMVIVTDPILCWIALIYFPGSFLHITDVCRVVYFLVYTATNISVWLTVTFTFDRFVAICCEKLKTKYCTKKTVAVVLGTVSVLSCSVSLPWYFVYESYYIVDNVHWGCISKQDFYASSAWIAFHMFCLILTPCVPFFLILLLNLLTVRHILMASSVRRGLRGCSNGENHKDPEMENRRKSIILLFSISSSFILLWMVQVLYNIYRRTADIQSYSSPNDPLYITDYASVMLQLLSTCTNTFIYVVTQAKFRQELKNAVKFPFNLIVKLIKS